MEPKNSSPEFSPELPSQVPEFQPGQYGPERPLEAPQTPERSGEAREGQFSQESAPAQAAPAPSSIALPTPVPVQPVQDDTATNGLPDVASDDDLIEKEWVDKAKQIIAETKDDPHKREQEVGRLQADYLKKRYGKELGASST